MATESKGIIESGKLYSIGALKEHYIGTWALRSMRRNGLPIRRVGSRSWVSGSDLIQFIEQKGKLVGSRNGEQV